MKKKIFMIGWEYPPTISGGLGIACQGIARALGAYGHNVLFLVPRLSGKEKSFPNVQLIDAGSELVTMLPEETKNLLPEGEITTSVYASAKYGQPGSTRKETIKSQSMFLQGGYGTRVYDEVSRYGQFVYLYSSLIDFDIIHAHDWVTFPAGIAARDMTGRPLVCHIHSTEIDRNGDNVNPVVYDIEKMGMEQADTVVAVSNFTRQIVIERYGIAAEKVVAVHNGVDFELPANFLRSEKKVPEHIVLFLGRLTFQKGPEYFVQAAKKVIEEIKNVRFVMVGTGDMYHRIIELAADLGIGRFFHYTGFLNRDQISRIFGMTDLYVMPSVSEPFGISPLEAIIHGVPVIVSRQSGVSEVLENCIKVDFWDIEQMSSNIIKVLSSKELSASMTDGAGGEIQKISWDSTAQKLDEVYNKFQV